MPLASTFAMVSQMPWSHATWASSWAMTAWGEGEGLGRVVLWLSAAPRANAAPAAATEGADGSSEHGQKLGRKSVSGGPLPKGSLP